ncbi:methyltransferase family protein [Reinekea sp.]|jgi:protein-S-isoprenylcysteine O-methyltransferase Ste14|uniref:methyltransferase family protein n=1 Tax=Reinekea sp. TaxID=1970455 RepID=UPI002A82C8B2|nr:NnrU family protein [Reinekea sp.]
MLVLILPLIGSVGFLLTNLWLVLFVTNVPLFPTILDPVQGSPSLLNALLINLLVMLVFGIQHSVMARVWFKDGCKKLFDERLFRAVYMIASGLALAFVLALWQPIPGQVFEVSSLWLVAPIWVVFALGLVMSSWAILAIDPLELMGFKQAWSRVKGQAWLDIEFKQPWLYRVVRHPMQLGIILILWATPLMSLNHLLFASSMTAYILIGLRFEERALARAFGQTYVDYQRAVPFLLPFTGFGRSRNT